MKSNHAKGAASIKADLQKKYPGIKFNVRSKSFAGGDSIYVNWDLGPTSTEVQQYIDKYSEGTFDGMIDLYGYDRDPERETFRKTNGSAKYVSASRGIPREANDIIIKSLCELSGTPFEMPYHNLKIWGNYADQEAWRAISGTSFPAGAVITGVRIENGDIKATYNLR